MRKGNIISAVICFMVVMCVCSVNAENLIKNATFNNNTDNWFHFNQDAGKGKIDTIDNQLHVTIENGGQHPWSMGVVQVNISIEEHYVYKVSFEAMSDSLKKIRVVKIKNGFLPYGDKLRNISRIIPRIYILKYIMNLPIT